MWKLFALLFALVSTAALAQDTGSYTVTSVQVANNTTSVAIRPGPGWVQSVEIFNNGATIAYLKLYDALQANVTCGSGTPKARYQVGASTVGPTVVNPRADLYTVGITACFTTGYADSDATAPAATTYSYNIHWR